MRLLLRDRISAGAIAVLVVYLLLLQGLLSGMAQGATAAPAVDPSMSSAPHREPSPSIPWGPKARPI
jgi:hypothetical protein